MFTEALSKAFDDMFEHLGQEVQFQPRGASPVVNIIAVVKQPENPYELGDSPIVNQVAEITIKSSSITPRIGDFVLVNNKEYKIYEEPKLDASTYIWKFHAVLVKR